MHQNELALVAQFAGALRTRALRTRALRTRALRAPGRRERLSSRLFLFYFRSSA